MCGITTLFEPSAPGWLSAVAQGMTSSLRHRGPDGDGLEVFDLCCKRLEAAAPGAVLALGHRRLAILDLSHSGRQPMADCAKKLWLTFNGEIYNYLELRSELRATGHEFHTGTDTEVILAAYREWGDACLPRLNGMFAFVLLDARGTEPRVLAARDRFGEKPLYLWRTPLGGLAIASEIKAFTAHPGWRARLHGQAAYDFLNWGVSDHGPETLFAGVVQLRGGEYLSATLTNFAQAGPRRWYELDAPEFRGDLAAAGERFRELFDESVRIRLRADVPVGSCLSGGLDSSAVVCTMREQLDEDATHSQNTFSAYSDVTRFDERRFAEDVVRATGATPHNLVPDPALLLRELDDIVWHQDEPFGSTSIFAQWCVYRLAREQGVKVMLDGQGADEALAGYHGFFGTRLSGLLRSGHWLRLLRESHELSRAGLMTLGLQARSIAHLLAPPAAAQALRRIARQATNRPVNIDITKLGAVAQSPHLRSVDLDDPVRSLCRQQLTRLSLPMLLHWADRDSMAHSVEARLPFLDHRLVEFCLGLPEEHKISDGWTKRVLREGMRGRLPESVRLRRDKLGFATAEEVWMRERNRPAFTRLLDEAIADSQGILTEDARRKAHRILDGKEGFSFLVWRMINFGQWLRRFNVSLTS